MAEAGLKPRGLKPTFHRSRFHCTNADAPVVDMPAAIAVEICTAMMFHTPEKLLPILRIELREPWLTEQAQPDLKAKLRVLEFRRTVE